VILPLNCCIFIRVLGLIKNCLWPSVARGLNIRKDAGLHQTDIFVNSLQRPFLDGNFLYKIVPSFTLDIR